MDGFPVFDVDSHFMEPPDLWADHIDPAFRGRVPVGSGDRGALVVDGDRRLPTVRWRRLAGGLSSLNEEWAHDVRASTTSVAGTPTRT